MLVLVQSMAAWTMRAPHLHLDSGTRSRAAFQNRRGNVCA